MSYPPPRPHMGLPPGMPPGMMHQGGYGFPMGPMMPMMPMPMMRPGGPPMPNNIMSSNNVPLKKKLVPQEIPKSDDDEKPPVTTVFVGNISDRAPDAMVRQMLQRCGNVLSWKRVQGASGKLQAFGFCEYEEPEATLRCIRLLNEWNITDRKLVVKVDAKTRTLLDEYKRKKKEREKNSGGPDTPKKNGDDDGEKEEGEADEDGPLDDQLDEFTMREDRVAKAGLDAIMREYAEDLAKAPPAEAAAEKKEKRKVVVPKEKDLAKDASLDDMELEEDKKDLINREIKSFRDAHKENESDQQQDEREKDRDRDRDKWRRREEERKKKKVPTATLR